MEFTELLTTFADPSKMKSLSLVQLLMGGLFTTLLGMGVTFVVLMILQFVLGFFGKLAIFKDPPGPEAPKKRAPVAKAPDQTTVASDNAELVAAITAALAMVLETPAGNLRIRSIMRVQDTAPVWWRTGVLDQMQNNL